MEGIEEPNENDDVKCWVEVDSNPLLALHESNKDGAPTIARMDMQNYLLCNKGRHDDVTCG